MIGRRDLLKIVAGATLAASAASFLLHTDRFLLHSPRGQPGGFWFEKISEEPSADDVILEFVDEEGSPLDFSAFLIWEPTGEAEEVAVKNGKLKIPKRRLVDQANAWRGELKGRGQPTLTENALLAIVPTSLPAEFLPYTAVVETPRLINRRYKLHGVRRSKKTNSLKFAACPEAKMLYISDADLRNYVPAVALKDASSKAFGEDVYYGYKVDGSVVKFSVYGVLSLGYGTSLRITSDYTWSTGDLKISGGAGYIPKNDGESAAVMFYSTIWRYLVYEVYDINTCTAVDQRAGFYMLNLAFENGSFALRGVSNPPPTTFEEVTVADTKTYSGRDGKLGDSNALQYIDIMNNEPLLDVSLNIRLGGGWGIGAVLNYLGLPFSWLIKRAHAGFTFQLYGGAANYVAIIRTDANPNASYSLQIMRASYTHYLKDYVFKPLRTAAVIVD